MSVQAQRNALVLALASLACPLTSKAQTASFQSLQCDGRVSAFYKWRAQLPSLPGVLLRTEALPARTRLEVGSAGSWRILNTSSDGARGKGIIAVSRRAILAARHAARRLMAAGGIGARHRRCCGHLCAVMGGRSLRDVTYLNAWLDAGFAVVAADYQGLRTPGPHPYLNTRPAAYNLLSSIRARKKGRVRTVWKNRAVGQSQGGTAVVADRRLRGRLCA